jgi:addiction module HigA family antidote
MTKGIKPLHPGRILLDEFLKPMGIGQAQLAVLISVSRRRIFEIVHAKRGISADTALRLGRYFGTSPQFWLGLQADYDLDLAGDKLGDKLKDDIRGYAPGSQWSSR